MAQTEPNTTPSLSRRSLVAGTAATLVSFPAAVAVIAAPVDPIFEAIERHKLAEEHTDAMLNALPVDFSFDFRNSADCRKWDRMKRPADRAAVALMDTVPTTAAGVAALLWYVHQNTDEGSTFGCSNIERLMRRRANAAFAQAARA